MLDVARCHKQVSISEKTLERAKLSHQMFKKAQLEKHIIYGTDTFFGARVNAGKLPEQKDEDQQLCLAKMLNCGSGPSLPDEWVRAAILARLMSLSQGHSGVRPLILEELCAMLNENEVPKIPEDGSIGASGDLVPLSYIAIAVNDRLVKKRMRLEGREVLALSNGTSVMTGALSSVIGDLLYLHGFAYDLFAVLFQCLEGVGSVFDEELHALKKHKGQQKTAAYFRNRLEGSHLLSTVEGRAAKGMPIQDAYSLRCLAHQTGPDKEAILMAQTLVERELSSVSDNPVIQPDNPEAPVLHGGHFDGRNITLASYMANFSIQGTAQLANAYMQRVCSSHLNGGLLPDYLVTGKCRSGLQGLSISASACHVRILQRLSPVTSITGNYYENGNQDAVSMGMHATVETGKAVNALRSNLARLAIFTRQAVGIRGVGNKLSPPTGIVYNLLCRHIPFVDEDRSLHGDIQRLETLLIDHSL